MTNVLYMACNVNTQTEWTYRDYEFYWNKEDAEKHAEFPNDVTNSIGTNTILSSISSISGKTPMKVVCTLFLTLGQGILRMRQNSFARTK